VHFTDDGQEIEGKPPSSLRRSERQPSQARARRSGSTIIALFDDIYSVRDAIQVDLSVDFKALDLNAPFFAWYLLH
jgi:hypothetical protein